MLMNLDLDKLIYLDAEFISRKYEELTGENPDESITKQEGAKAGIKTFFVNAGVHTQESRSYSVTSRQMLQVIWKKLDSLYPTFEEESFENYQGTKIFWIEGNLTIAEWKERDSNKPGYEFFQLNHNNQKSAFLSHKEYYAAGFREVFSASSALKGNVGIPVKCLSRIMWHVDDAKNYTACPYIIIENKAANKAN